MENWYRKFVNIIQESQETRIQEDGYTSRFAGSPNKRGEPKLRYPKAQAYKLTLEIKDSKDLPESIRDVASIINREYAKSEDGRFPNDAKRGGFFKDKEGRILGTWGIRPVDTNLR